MLRFEFIDNINTTFAADNFVIGTDFLDTSTHFHADHSPYFRVNDTLLTLIMSPVQSQNGAV